MSRARMSDRVGLTLIALPCSLTPRSRYLCVRISPSVSPCSGLRPRRRRRIAVFSKHSLNARAGLDKQSKAISVRAEDGCT